jgi:hypothetical protein
MGTTLTVGDWRLDRDMDASPGPSSWALYRPPTSHAPRAIALVTDFPSRGDLMAWLERQLVPATEADQLANLWRPVSSIGAW